MNTETKAPKKQKRIRNNEPVTLEEISREDADAVFNAVKLRSPLTKTLHALKIGTPVIVRGASYNTTKSAAKSLGDRYGIKILVSERENDRAVFAERVEPDIEQPEPLAEASV